EVDRRGKNAAVPERHDRLAAGIEHALVVLGAFGTPAERRAERGDDRVPERGDQSRLNALRSRLPPVARRHARGWSLPLTNVMRSTNCTSAPALACAPLSMIEQNGQAVTTVSAPVSRSCLKRTSLMRPPGSSSLSAKRRPPPAPQQYGLSRLRIGSAIWPPKRLINAR